MKKIYLSMMAMAIAAFTFTSCEDVPEPYNNPYDQIKPSEPEVVIEPAGEGTKESPWNVAAVIEACSSLNDGDFLNDGAEVFVTGIVTETTDISTSYGNATYYISDNAKASNKFYVYRGKLLDGAAVAADTDLEVGDSVTVCGKIKNYKGTMEFDQGNYLVYYKKGEGGGGDTPTPDAPGTAEKPLTVAEALAYIDANLEADKQSPVGYVKGIIVSVTEISTSYGNATYIISDDGTDATTLQVYRGLGLGGEKFTSEDALKAGDVVIVTGKLVNYKGNTKQFAQGSQLVQLNDKKAEGGGDTPSGEGEGKGTADSPYNVTAAIAAGSGTGVYVKAFIVGSIDGKSTTDAKFSAETATASNILIAASADETDINKCMPVQLPSGAVRSALNLVDNASNYKKEVTLYGNIEKYFSVTGIKAVSFAILNGTEIGTNPAGGSGGGDTPSGDAKGSGTQADPWNVAALLAQTANLADGEFLNNGAEVYAKGIVTEVKELSTQYGNVTYYISDDSQASNKFYVFRGKLLDGAAVTSDTDLKVGDKVTICGKIKNYKGTVEFDQGNYLVSLNSGGSEGGGDTPSSSTGTLENPLTASQAYDIVAAMEGGKTSEEDYYVKGKISSIKFTFSAQYGTATFNISDDGATGGKEFIAYSCYYFGNQPWVEGNTQVQVGDEVIVCGKVINYQGNTPEFASKKNYLVKLNSQTSASRQYSK